MATQTKPVTAKNFNSKLSAFVKASSTQRDNLQHLVEFAAVHYNEHAHPVYFNKALAAAVEVKGFSSRLLQQYIESHTNLVWSKGKDEKPAFRAVKGSEFKCMTELFGSTKWYLHSEEGQAVADWKASSYAKRVASKLISEGADLVEFIELLEAARKAAIANGAKQKQKPATAEATGAR